MSREDIMFYLERKMRGGQESRRTHSDSHKNRGKYAEDHDYEDGRGHRHSVEHRRSESREASKTHNARGSYYDDDYDDDAKYEEDEEEYHSYRHLRLTKADISKWEKMLHNADGTHGPHYTFEQAIMIAEKVGIRFDSYTEREFHMCLNMMYADYGSVVAKHVPPEKLLQFLAELAKAFFDDPDGPEPSEKLALYFHCVASADE